LGKAHLRHEEVVSSSSNGIFEVAVPDRDPLVTDTPEAPLLSPEDTAAGEELPLLLIVEDNADVRHYIQDIFATSYRILTAVDGMEGLSIALETVPDVIISDLMMPGMDGVALCRKLKTDESTSHIPVVLLTAKASLDSKMEGLEEGADDYITKPFYPFELRIRVNNLVEQRRKLRELFGRELVIQPKHIAVSSVDEKFLRRAIEVVEQYLSDPGFNIEQFGREVGLSRVQLHRKLKALTGQPPGDFIRVFRLKRAASLLEQKWGNVAQIAYEVGFDNLSYFSQCFRQQFGCPPSKYP
jgi:DNA-binding response OmpR family regulator